MPLKIIEPLLMEQLPMPSVMEMALAWILTMLLPSMTRMPSFRICTCLPGRESCRTMRPFCGVYSKSLWRSWRLHRNPFCLFGGGKQPFQHILMVFFGGVSAFHQQICRAHIGHLTVCQGAAGHAKCELFLRRLFQRFHQLGTEHDGIHTVRLADNMGVHGKIQPVCIVACVYEIHRPDDVAGLHSVVLLQCLHTGCKGVVCAVGVKFHDAGNDAKLLHRGVVLIQPSSKL